MSRKSQVAWMVLLCGGLATALAASDSSDPAGARKPLALESIGPIAFGPDHTILISEPTAASVHAIELSEPAGEPLGADLLVEGLGEKVAALLGTSAEDVRFVDLAVDPGTAQAYLSVLRGQGRETIAALIRVSGAGELSDVPLEELKYTSTTLANPPSQQSGRRGEDGRMEAITDIEYVEGKVIVAGLSNEEFSSKLRTLDFPFTGGQDDTSVEIYHSAHGRLETNAPVRTFLPYDINGEPHIVAAYTCTPLVVFPMAEIVPDGHIVGKTIAELGNRNRPLDMIAYERDGAPFLLMANSSRGVMKIDAAGLETFEAIQTRVGGGGLKGVPYETEDELQGVVQLAKLDDEHALVLIQGEDGKRTLKAIELP